MKRFVSVLLILAAVAGILVSCSGTTGEPAATTAADSETVSVQTEAAPETTYAPLPDRDLKGKTFNALIRTEWKYEFVPEDESTDVLVAEAITERNARVEEKYNMKLNFIDTKGDWNNRENFINAVHNTVMAGDGAYDFIAGYQATIVQNVTRGDLLNLLDLPYIELDKPWWTQKGVDSLTVNKRCFIATGDITVTMLEYLYCFYFNKNLAKDHDLPDLYAIVDEGKWTHDKLTELITGLSVDLDGDGTLTEKDRFALISGGDYLRQYLVAYDTPVASKKADGSPYLSWNTPRTVSVVEKLNNQYNDSKETYISTDKTKLTNLFRNDQAVFATGLFGQAAKMRDMASDFGILPYPKFSEDQPDYLTSTNNNVSMIAVPITCKDTENTAFLIEAMCRESTDTISAAFYDTALKSKYARDENSVRMVDLIRNSLSFDFGWVYSTVLNLGGSYETFVVDKNTDFASYYASRVNEYTTNLEQIFSTYYD